jgi:transposase
MRYELSDAEWRILSGMLPNKPRGLLLWTTDAFSMASFGWSGAPGRDLPEVYGPRTTCYNRSVRCNERASGKTS